MDDVQEIWYLSEKGYQFLEKGDFGSAKTYFMDAASLAIHRQKISPRNHKKEYETVARSLMKLANDAHEQNFKQMKNALMINESRRQKSIESEMRDQIDQIHGKSFAIPLGTQYHSDKRIFWKPEKLMNGIMTITGGSGSGKTECLKMIATELTKRKIPVLLFDLHGNIEIDIPTISLDYTAQFSINPMELTSKSVIDGGPIPHINKLMTQFTYAISDRFSATQKNWLRNLIKFSYYKHGILQDDPSSWENPAPNFEYLLNLVKNPESVFELEENNEYKRYYELINTSTRLAIENRLAHILEHPAFSGKTNIELDSLIEQPHRILLKPLNTIDMQFLAADTIMRQIFSTLVSKGHIDPDAKHGKFRMFIIIDEVKILTGYRGTLNDPYHILNRFATEARKFGLGLILASQVLGHFGRDIRSNAATKLILKTMDQDEAKKCSKELKIQLSELTSLNKPGEGFLITSNKKDARRIQLKRVS
ncbi:MAG: ATP-binding protein [Candidatus Heimdallarchaeota archaeon]|nr:ATP-binding protein [Candidatus Heimdallarchaeota archaeon]